MDVENSRTAELVEEIRKLKKKRGAAILAHYNTKGEIQHLADITGDTLA